MYVYGPVFLSGFLVLKTKSLLFEIQKKIKYNRQFSAAPMHVFGFVFALEFFVFFLVVQRP